MRQGSCLINTSAPSGPIWPIAASLARSLVEGISRVISHVTCLRFWTRRDLHHQIRSKKKKHFGLPFLVFRLVTNRRLLPVLQRTMSYGASQVPCCMVLQQTLLGPTWPINPNISAPFQEPKNTQKVLTGTGGGNTAYSLWLFRKPSGVLLSSM